MEMPCGDLRQTLQAEFARRRTKNSRYSLRMLARHLEIPAGRLSELMSGKRRPTRALAEKVADRLALPIEHRQSLLEPFAADPLEAAAAQEFRAISFDAFHAIADAAHFAILSAMELDDFRPQAEWLAERLGASQVHVRACIERLERLGLIRIEGARWTKAHGSVATTDGVSSAALRLSHKQSLEQAIQALEAVPFELRDVTSMTMAIDSDRIEAAKKMIKRFRRRLCAYLESGEKKDAVYNLNVQLVPLTANVSAPIRRRK